MAERVLALELGTDGLRAAVVESTLRRFSISEIHELNDSEFAGTLGGARWDRVTVGLAADAAAFRFLELPFNDKRRIKRTAGVALEDHVPFSLEDGETAWDRTSPGHHGQILAVIAPRTRLDSVRRRLAAMDIEQAELVWTPTAALECFSRSLAEGSSYIAVNSSATSTTVAAVREGVLSGLRVIGPGSGQRTARDVAWAVASLAPDIERVVCAGPAADEGMEELSSRLAGHQLERLAGDCPVEAPGLLAEQWTEHITLLGLVATAGGECGRPSVAFQHGSAAPSAAGMEEAGFGQLGRWAAAAGLLLITATAVDHIRLGRKHADLVRQADQITARAMPSAAGHGGRKLKLEMRLSELEGRVGQHPTTAGYASPLAALVAMSAAVPAEIKVELESYQYDPPSIRLAGHGSDYEAVTKLEEALRAHRDFSAVEVIEVRADIAGEGVDFRLELTLAIPGPAHNS